MSGPLGIRSVAAGSAGRFSRDEGVTVGDSEWQTDDLPDATWGTDVGPWFFWWELVIYAGVVAVIVGVVVWAIGQ